MSELLTKPTEFEAHTMPRAIHHPSIAFRFNSGEMGISMSLFELLDVHESRRAKFVLFQGDLYITRVDKDGFWMNVSGRPSKYSRYKFSSVVIQSKTHTQHFMRAMGYGPGDVSNIKVALHQVTAEELKLNPLLNPYPFYRLIIDQKLKLA